MSKNTETIKFYTPRSPEETLPDCAFNFGHLENGKWIKKKCHCNCNCEFATYGICNDTGAVGSKNVAVYS